MPKLADVQRGALDTIKSERKTRAKQQARQEVASRRLKGLGLLADTHRADVMRALTLHSVKAEPDIPFMGRTPASIAVSGLPADAGVQRLLTARIDAHHTTTHDGRRKQAKATIRFSVMPLDSLEKERAGDFWNIDSKQERPLKGREPVSSFFVVGDQLPEQPATLHDLKDEIMYLGQTHAPSARFGRSFYWNRHQMTKRVEAFRGALQIIENGLATLPELNAPFIEQVGVPLQLEAGMVTRQLGA